MKLTLTDRIRAAVDQWGKTNQSPPNQISDAWIDHELLARVSQAVGVPLVELVRGCAVYISTPEPKPAKSPEYLAMMNRLRVEAQEKEYRELAGLKDEVGPMFAGSDAKQVKEELTTILNFAISVFAVGFSLWYWARWWDAASRTLLAIIGSLVVLVAEIVVYASYRSKVEEARRIENTKKHVSKPIAMVNDSLLMAEKQEQTSSPPSSKTKTKNRKKKNPKQSTLASSTGSQNPTLHPRVKTH